MRCALLHCTTYFSVLKMFAQDNVTQLLLFRTKNQEVLKNIFLEVADDVTEEAFYMAYEEATKEPHSFMCIDFHPARYSRSIKLAAERTTNNSRQFFGVSQIVRLPKIMALAAISEHYAVFSVVIEISSFHSTGRAIRHVAIVLMFCTNPQIISRII